MHDIDLTLENFDVGVEHVGGDMFESVPEGGDAIFIKVVTTNKDAMWNS